MVLQEAIEHAREVAEGCAAGNKECAYQHDKLADWLEELKKVKDILGSDYKLDRLRDLVEADRDGRCTVSPVKLGQRIWYIKTDFEICVGKITGLWFNIYTNPQLWIQVKYRSKTTGEHEYESRIDLMLRKTVFLTHESAESALKGEKNHGL